MKRILVVDDDTSCHEIIKTILEELNYVVHTISNPEETMETIRIMYPDLIILDWCMPQQDGISVLKTIKCHPDYKYIPVILSTGIRCSPSELKIALEEGAVDFLRKPLDEVEVDARVSSIFRTMHEHKKQLDLAVRFKNEQLDNEKKHRNILEAELYKKKQEIKLTAVTINQNQNFISNLKDEIANSEIEFAPQQKKYLSRLLNKYVNLSTSADWIFFSQQFTELNAPFYAKINAIAPDITWGELRFCALLKIGLSLKEISVANNSSYDAVKKALYRLRRKLHLKEEDNIYFILQKL